MLCKKCGGRVFIDRQYSTIDHMETFCILCGKRTFFHPPSQSLEGRWLLEKEKSRVKNTMTSL
jgi:hypothetical protein